VPDTLKIDFTSGAIAHRLHFGGGRGQALPRAIGLKNGKTPDVVDATAGLGRDAFLLASLGCRVTLIERSPEMHALLADGLARAKNSEVGEIVARMTLLFGDAMNVLPTLAPDVILIDPMHPERKKSALVKKEMRLIRQIVGVDSDASELLAVALDCARKRVILKWPQKADPIEGVRPPSHRIEGKSTRYDVFMLG